MRVNVRFDGEYERQMEFLSEATGLGVSEVLKASVAHYYQVVSASTQSKLPNLRPFIGKAGSGRANVSVSGKNSSATVSLPSIRSNPPRVRVPANDCGRYGISLRPIGQRRCLACKS